MAYTVYIFHSATNPATATASEITPTGGYTTNIALWGGGAVAGALSSRAVAVCTDTWAAVNFHSAASPGTATASEITPTGGYTTKIALYDSSAPIAGGISSRNLVFQQARTARLQTGMARIQATTPRAQTGKAKIQVTVTTDRTQLGEARIQRTVDKTQPGKSRIQVTVDRTQLGLARIVDAIHPADTRETQRVIEVGEKPGTTTTRETQRVIEVGEKPGTVTTRETQRVIEVSKFPPLTTTRVTQRLIEVALARQKGEYFCYIEDPWAHS